MLLGERYPTGESTTEIPVDYQNIAGTVSPDCLRIGEWINVVGEVEHTPGTSTNSANTREAANVGVVALHVWSAGLVDLKDYNQTVLELQAI